ncbi:TetR family transcriptional regulator [Actinocatenispora thailandica]|uniref:TetR family transcriptional regulator n=1 Tax=Actinocatenispora thailandica TaxID=227318 RepID=A0A7R7HY40_9ACTN|nr:TetR/AcrR family transcriptional regulator [Actinocatenispora thailandica]BCJ35824.1 TetR family transcriptional regulator [Actinocatenispora thailandica]
MARRSAAPAAGSAAGGGRREQAAATAAALKAAAVRVFDERGYLNTKITDITAAAGRSAGSFYNHFTGKEALLETLLADMLTASDERVDREHPYDHDLSDRDVLRWHVAGFWEAFRDNKPVFVAVTQAAMVDEHFGARLADLMSPDQGAIRRHLELLADKGFALPGEPAAVAVALTGMWFQFTYRQLVGGFLGGVPELSDEAAIDLLTEFSWRGLIGGQHRTARPEGA